MPRLPSHLFGHPLGFHVLFLTELWERFGFYLMRALLVLYCVKVLGLSEEQAAEWFGWYLGAVYLMPTPMGIIADRYLGSGRAVVIGSAVMIVGHLVMAVEQRWAAVLAMGLLAIGGGLFKPSMNAQLSKLYEKDDEERHDRAFSLFYVGINMGALLSPLAGWWLQKRFGWSVAFGSAGVGLAIGQLTYLLGRRFIVDRRNEAISVSPFNLKPVIGKQEEPSDTGRRIAAVLALSLLTSLFWASYYADGGVLILWAKSSVRGFGDKAALTNMMNPACILLLTAPIAWALAAWGRRKGKPVSSLTKLVIGYSFGAMAFLPIAWAARSASASANWVLGFYVLITIGELLVQPLGMALVAKLAPPKHQAFLLGVWLLSSSLGGVVIGQLARWWNSMPHSAFFLLLAGLPAVGALSLLGLWKPLSRLLGETDSEQTVEVRRQRPVLRLVRGWRKAA